MRLQVSQIDFHKLRVYEHSDTKDLESSFSRLGQLSPILVRKSRSATGKYEVIFGNRRLAAAKKLGWESIEAQVVESSDIQSLLIAFAENCDRVDFTDYEKALVIEELHERTGKSYTEIAGQIGKSSAFVSQHLAMLHLFPEGIAADEERSKVLHSLTENHARILARVGDPVERWSTAKLAIKANLSVRELEKFCAKSFHKRGQVNDDNEHGNPVKDVITQIMEGLRSKNLRTFYGPVNKHFTMFSRYPPLRLMDGTEAEEHTSNIIRQMKEYDVEIQDLTARVFGDFAYATIVRVDKFRVGNRRFTISTRGTIVLFRDESWQILHEHWSPGDPELIDLMKSEKEKDQKCCPGVK